MRSVQTLHTKVSIGPRTCRQGKVVTICLVRIFRHTLELSTTVIGSSLRQLPPMELTLRLTIYMKKKTQWHYIETVFYVANSGLMLHH